MALSDLRDTIVRMSGRVDLVNEDGSDNGLNRMINQAQDFLESTGDHPKMRRRHVANLSSSGYWLDLPRCLSIEEVWVMGTIDGSVQRRQLREKTFTWLRQNYAEAYSAITTGTPYFYAPAINAVDDSLHAADAIFGESPTITDDVEGLKSDDYGYTGLLILPPADSSYVVTVIGEFFSKKLVLDADINYWTEQQPDILAQATVMVMEGALRNVQGVRGMLALLEPMLVGLDKTAASLSGGNVNQMEG